MTIVARTDTTARPYGLNLPLPGLTLCLGACVPALAASLGVHSPLVPIGLALLAAGSLLIVAARHEPWRGGLGRLLQLPALLIVTALVFLGLAATPLAPGGVHPLWASVGSGAAVLDLEACLVGGLAMAGLGLGGVLATQAGAARKSSSRVIALLPILFLLPEAALLVRLLWADDPMAAPLLAVFLGSSLVLCAAAVLRTFRIERPRTFFGWLRTAGADLWIGAAAFIVLARTDLKGLIAAIAALLVLIGWDALAASGTGRLRRGPLFLVLGLLAAVVVAGGVLGLTRVGEPEGATACRDAHLAAVSASPWLGYGPGSGAAVASLSMTRANIDALSDPACPRSAYIAALEQGGVLVAAPVLLAFAALAWSAISGSMRRRSMAGAIRALVCATGFCSLFAAVDAAPGTLAGLTPAVLMLAMAAGASGVSR